MSISRLDSNWRAGISFVLGCQKLVAKGHQARSFLMLKKMMSNVSSKRLSEERLYEKALSELENGAVRKGIWAKALVASEGDDKKAGAIYVKLRVESLVDEATVLKAEFEERESAKKMIQETAARSHKPSSGKQRGVEERDLWVRILVAWFVFAAAVIVVKTFLGLE
jgi:hypothetical protein